MNDDYARGIRHGFYEAMVFLIVASTPVLLFSFVDHVLGMIAFFVLLGVIIGMPLGAWQQRRALASLAKAPQAPQDAPDASVAG